MRRIILNLILSCSAVLKADAITSSFYSPALGVFPLNYLLGDGVNYLYLRDKPQVGSLMDFMPNPPTHIPIVLLLAYVFFWLVYLPYFFKDLFMKRKALT